MPWEPLAPAPPPERLPAEHLLWALTRGVGRAEMRVRLHPHGHELRALLDRGNGLTLLWSQVYKFGHGADLGALADDEQAKWLERGWGEP